MAVSMDEMMKERIGKSETVRVVFKKTMNIRQYESEVLEADTSVELDGSVTGIERMIIVHELLGQLEYAMMVKLVIRGVITKQDMDKAVEKTEHGLKLLYDKAKSLGIEPHIEQYI